MAPRRSRLRGRCRRFAHQWGLLRRRSCQWLAGEHQVDRPGLAGRHRRDGRCLRHVGCSCLRPSLRATPFVCGASEQMDVEPLAGGDAPRLVLVVQPHAGPPTPVSYTHLRAHETLMNL
eukprot:3406728-Prymnesium_polylepis.2